MSWNNEWMTKVLLYLGLYYCILPRLTALPQTLKQFEVKTDENSFYDVQLIPNSPIRESMFCEISSTV